MNEAVLKNHLSLAEQTAQAQGYVLRRILHEPAEDLEIAWAETQLGRPLPPSLRSFLKVHDGFELAIVDEGPGPDIIMHRIRILGAAEIVRYRNGEDEESRYRRPPIMAPSNRVIYERGIPLGNYEGGSDFLLFDPECSGPEYPIVDAYTETDDPWSTVASNFDEFLVRILESAAKRCDFAYWAWPGS